MTTIIRPGQRIVNIPGIGITMHSGRATLHAGGGNWWEAGGASGCLAAYQPKGAASLAASYVNLANPGTYDAAPGTAPSFAAATGWTFDGTTQYLNSGVSSAYNASRDRYDRCLIVRWSGASFAGINHRAIGAHWSANDGLGLGKYYVEAFMNGGNATGGTPAAAAVYAINYNGDGYKDGVYQTTAGTSTSEQTTALPIGASSWGGGVEYFFNGNILALAIYDNELSSAAIAAISAAMAAL